MKNCLSALALIVAFEGSALQAQTNFVKTGNDLSLTCSHFLASDNRSTFNDGVCFGYIVGVTALVNDCEGQNVTYGQEIRVVLKYMDDHPEQLDQQSTAIIRRALLGAFPCGK